MRFPAPVFIALASLGTASAAHQLADSQFYQDESVRFRVAPELAGAHWRKVVADRDGIVYALSDRGLARVYDHALTPDRNFRPLAKRRPLDIAVSPSGDLYYLFDSEWLSNGNAGAPRGDIVPAGAYLQLAVGRDGDVWLAGPAGLARSTPDSPVPTVVATGGPWSQLSVAGDWVFALEGGRPSAWSRIDGRRVALNWGPARALAAAGGRVVAGGDDGRSVALSRPPWSAGLRDAKLPCPDIRCLAVTPAGYWAGGSRGAFFESFGGPSPWATPEAGPAAPAPRFRYYAGKRWLDDDQVVSLAIDGSQQVWVLTEGGLRAIQFRRWTLADKAAWFQQKIRSRHIRYGFSAERSLSIPGDPASGEMIDTDNDGGWSSYWLASQAFRYAVTRNPEAKAWAWETFAALERLQTMHTNTGFPARTFERTGFKVSDPDRWRTASDPGWEWKGHTSSDEIASHMFAYAILWECGAESTAEKGRIAAAVDSIATHILDHHLYLVDVDGNPTLWGRWNPDYVNGFPPTVYDRRLNSAETIATMELAHRVTGKTRFRDAALDLMSRAGYLTNITRSMRTLRATAYTSPTGVSMGEEWNHSDDELGFVTYWVLCRFAFDAALRRQFVSSVADHWDLEKPERYPFWNFVAAGCGLSDTDTPGAVWTLRGFPLDTVSWTISNSGRGDITRLPDNYRRQELAELLPPGERQAVRCNTQPFILDGGNGGRTEFAGDEFLLGYWMGRYVGAIGRPESP